MMTSVSTFLNGKAELFDLSGGVNALEQVSIIT